MLLQRTFGPYRVLNVQHKAVTLEEHHIPNIVSSDRLTLSPAQAQVIENP